MISLKQILMVTALSVILMSCRDSLGIDDKYIKIPLDNPKEDNSFLIDNPDFEFTEETGKNTENSQTFKLDNYLLNSGSFKVDTSGVKPIMWIEMNVSYIDDTAEEFVSNSRVLDFKLKLDSAEFGTDYLLNGNIDGSNWISVTVLNEITGEVSILSGTDLVAEIEFIDFDPLTNVIICQLTIMLPGKGNGNEVLFKGIFKFKLKSSPKHKPISVKPKRI
jgi:hypothetical protein